VVSGRLRRLEAELANVDQAHGPLGLELIDLHDDLERLGVMDQLTPAESLPITQDNFHETLRDRAGIAAVRSALRIATRVVSTQLHAADRSRDWEGSEWDVVIVHASRDGSSSDVFVGSLAHELANQWNLAAWIAPWPLSPDDEDRYPPTWSVATNDDQFRDWTHSWGGRLVWWVEGTEGLRLRVESAAMHGPFEKFTYADSDAAAIRAAELLAEGDESIERAAEMVISVDEHRALESVLTAVVEVSETLAIAAEDRAQIDVLIQMLQLQLRAPAPDRPIIGRILRGLGTVGGGVLLGVAGNYFSDLLKRFGMPWP